MKTLKIILPVIFCFSLLFTEILTAQKEYKPIVKKSVFFGKSKAIRDVTIVLPGPEKERKEVEVNPLPKFAYDRSQITQERLIPENIQDHFGSVRTRGPVLNIEGMDNVNGGWPADPNGDVGINHYVQSVNNSTAFWDKAGNLLYGPIDNKSIFNAFPGPWHLLYWSDPVIVYDALADRWVFSSMSLKLDQSPYYEMVAVSVTPDPLGEYYCYAYEFDDVNDYPKMSVWPNGYYLTYNIFEYSGDWNFLYSLVTAVDREAMLAGDSSATMVQFELAPPADNLIRMSSLTSDINGTTLPDNPECFVVIPEYKMQGFPWETNLDFYSMQPDWTTPENSTFDSVTQINVEGIFPTFWTTNAPQPGNFHDVEPINFFMMYPLTYRNFDDYETMVACHTLYDGEKHYIRWYEFRKDTANWYIYQTGNYMPDSASRYVPSISINGKGDIAMVFTKSSLEIYPSMCATGRRADDSLGMMTVGELEIWKGLNYANNLGSSGRNRWGDYASMMVDPVNDTTFWFTSMYPIATTGKGNWSTRIVAMNLTEETESPSVYAGPDTVICWNEMFNIKGEASNYSSIQWDTDGDGWFTDLHKLNTTYVRGDNDVDSGRVHLKLSVSGYESGTMVSDSMTLFLNKFPEVTAGPDDTLCVNDAYACQGEVAYSEEYYWTSTGSGTFNDSTLLDAIYTPAPGDTALEKIVLTLHAKPLFPCTLGDEDELYLYLTQPAKAMAGPDDTLCMNESYACQGEVSFTDSYYWTSTGSGTFNDSTLLDAIYTPAMSDTTLEKVILTLHAGSLPPCTTVVEDELHLKIESCLGIQEISNSVRLQVYPNPSTGLVTVEAGAPGNDDVRLRVINSQGKTIFNGLFPVRNGHLKKQFDFTLLQSGIYYIMVSHNAKTRTVQLIIQ